MEVLPILPRTDDPDTSGFFEAARRGKLVVKKCKDCGRCLNPPRAYCDACGGWNTDWAEVSLNGKLVSWTVVAHSVHPAYPAPYTLVLVEVTDEPEVKLIGSVEGAPPLQSGMAMEAWFQPVGDVVLPQWRPKN